MNEYKKDYHVDNWLIDKMNKPTVVYIYISKMIFNRAMLFFHGIYYKSE